MHTTTQRLKEECDRLTPKHDTSFSLQNIPNLFSELFSSSHEEAGHQEELERSAPASQFEDENTRELKDMMHHLQVLMVKADALNGRTMKAEARAADAEKNASNLKQEVCVCLLSKSTPCLSLFSWFYFRFSLSHIK
jgi:hypothetical protein